LNGKGPEHRSKDRYWRNKRRGVTEAPAKGRRHDDQATLVYLIVSCDSFWSEAAAALAATAYQKMNLMAVTSFLMLGLTGY
jgi:hypothetical protein